MAAALRQLHKWHPGSPLDVAAISHAVSPAVIAALGNDLAPRVAFLVGICGYHDIEAVIRFVMTGVFGPLGDSRELRLEPNGYGRWAFLLANAGRLGDAVDTRRLQEIARLRFRDPSADMAPLAAAPGPQGRAVLALVDNRDPQAVGTLIAALPEHVRREIDGLNPALCDLSKLRGHLIPVHGRGDTFIPYSES